MELNQLLAMMVEKKASVLHLVAGTPPTVKSEMGGLVPLTGESLSPSDVKRLVESCLTEQQKVALLRQKELFTTYSVEGLSRFRTSLFYQRGTLAAVFRMIPLSPPRLDELGLPELIKAIVSRPSGLVLITGPKSSGKSTTLAAIIDYMLETRACHIVSIESPIEFLLKNKKGIIYQREVGIDTLSLASALATARRQNPDVLVVTELPDIETISYVLSSASTGQLVIAIFPSIGTLTAISQIIDLFPPHQHQQIRAQMATGLELVLGHTMLNKVHGGNILALEVLVGTLSVKGMIREGKVDQLLNAMNTGREVGMQSQDLALKMLVKKKVVTEEEAMNKAIRPEEFRRFMSMPF